MYGVELTIFSRFGVQSTMRQTRFLLVALAVVLLVGLAFVPEGVSGDRVALAALLSVGLACALGWSELLTGLHATAASSPQLDAHGFRYSWLIAAIATASMAAFS